MGEKGLLYSFEKNLTEDALIFYGFIELKVSKVRYLESYLTREILRGRNESQMVLLEGI